MWSKVGVQLITQAQYLYRIIYHISDLQQWQKSVSPLSYTRIYDNIDEDDDDKDDEDDDEDDGRWTMDEKTDLAAAVEGEYQKNSIILSLLYTNLFPFTSHPPFRNRFQDFLLRFQRRLLEIFA